MRPNGYRNALLTMAALVLVASTAMAAPNVNGISFNTRVFDDCPFSTLTTNDMYPSMIQISDENLSCGGFANLHTWSFSDDGGATDVAFNNGDWFRFAADLVVDGTSEGEAGLRISPWWSKYVDGRVNVRTTDGEIACFGGRLPFFSFTGAFGVNYAKGEVIHIEMIYKPQALSSSNPGAIQYNLVYGGMSYSSGWLLFDEGNPAEPYGTWGILDDARAGGFVQPFLQAGNTAAALTATWNNVEYEILQPISTDEQGWGALKALYND